MMTTDNPNTAFKTTDNTHRHNHTILHHIGRRLLLLTTLLTMAVGVKAQLADGVYTINNNFNQRGTMCYGTYNSTEYFALADIALSGYTNRDVAVTQDANKYWYVTNKNGKFFIYNIGKGLFLQDHNDTKATCAADCNNGFILETKKEGVNSYTCVLSGENHYLSFSCGYYPNEGQIRWLGYEAAAAALTFTLVPDGTTTYATQITDAEKEIANSSKRNLGFVPKMSDATTTYSYRIVNTRRHIDIDNSEDYYIYPILNDNGTYGRRLKMTSTGDDSEESEQYWYFLDAGDGYCYIVNRATGAYVYHNTEADANKQMELSTSRRTKFKIEASEYTSGDVTYNSYYILTEKDKNKSLNPHGGNTGYISAYNKSDGGSQWFFDDEAEISRCANPEITISGRYVTITVPTGTTVYYTTDGSTPTTASTSLEANSSFLHDNLVAGKSILAIATKADTYNSPIASKSLVASPTPLIFFNKDYTKVTLTSSNNEAKIYYTTNGNEPDYSLTPITDEIEFTYADCKGKTIKAFTLLEGYIKSEVIEYTIGATQTISSATDLKKIKNDPTGIYLLTSDINLSSHESIENFTGIFDGQHHVISELDAPLFATTKGATIKNISIERANISGTGNVGAIASTASGATRIYNCGILSGTISGSTNVGSIVGRLEENARVINCYSYANITGGNLVGGIVGNNSVDYDANNLHTLVMNCIYYGELSGTSIYPIFGGENIPNNLGINTYNFFRLNSETDYTAYNSAQAITKDDYLTRFEFYRHILNSNRELAAIYTLGDTARQEDMGKWTLHNDKEKYPYPIVTQPITNTRKTTGRTIPTTTEENKGKKIKNINVAIYIKGKPVFNGTLPVTDMNIAEWDYTYGKVVLPFANEFKDWNIDIGNNEVITGWQIDENDYYYTNENTLFDNTDYVYAQGGNYIVPEGVTTITLTAYVAPAVYLSDASYDIVYNSDYTIPLECGGKTPTLYKGQKVYNKLSDAIDALPYSGETEKYPYKQAIVLVGNFHFNQSSGIEPETFPNAHGHSSFVKNRPFTLMSADNDFDQEPDYCFYQYHCHGSGRSMVHPIRFDFLTSPGIGMAAHIEEGTKMPSIGILHGKGWFEQTETFLAYMTECELRPANYLTESPWILNGGIFEKIVVQTTDEYDASKRNENHLTYLKIGGNAYINELHPGTHSGYADLITLKPIYVSGGEIVQCYMTGKETNTSADTDGDINFYCNGGYIHEFLGAYQEKQNGSINVTMDHALVDNFYGGGASETHGTNGDINLKINNSHINFFCGGPKYGNMAADKAITIVANGTTFGEFYGGGYGGTALTRVQRDHKAGRDLPLNEETTPFPLPFSNYTSRRLNNDTEGVAVGYHMGFSYYAGGNGLGVSQFSVDYARLSLAQTNMITSTLTNCTILNDFYGGGCQGRVTGEVKSTLTNCTVLGSAFAGGYTAAVTPISVYPTDPPTYSKYIKALGSFTPFGTTPPETYKWKQATDGHAAGTVDTENKYIYTDVDMSKMGEVNGHTTIEIKGTTSNSHIYGSVFGGGNASKVIGNTHVHIQGGTIDGNVFGAGNQAEVTGKTEVVIGQ